MGFLDCGMCINLLVMQVGICCYKICKTVFPVVNAAPSFISQSHLPLDRRMRRGLCSGGNLSIDQT